MATVRKVTSRVKLSAASEEAQQVKVKPRVDEAKTKPVTPETVAPGEQKEEAVKRPAKKYCQFCVGKNDPHYWDAASLRRFLSDRGRIHARTRTGTCSKHQRRVAKEIKRARFLAILPFAVRV